MTTFFVGWELWQQMTFVLACLIAIVFMIGFLKLWRTNHILRRYELLDQEKRSRLAEMQQYGIDIPAINDIPFGSRAIQSGIEIDEIWISRPNTPVPSQRPSCATVVDDSSIDGKLARNESSSVLSAPDASCRKGKAFAQPSPGTRILKRSALSEQHYSESTTLDGQGTDNLLPASRSGDLSRPESTIQSEPLRCASGARPASDVGPVVAKRLAPDRKPEPLPHGTAEVFANTRTRRTVSGFEILPAGSLGERVELHASARLSEEHLSPNEEARAPNKLQKPRPRRQS
ncbi:hypothetical protein ARSEF1564_004408 [Beauveria bassiana]